MIEYDSTSLSGSNTCVIGDVYDFMLFFESLYFLQENFNVWIEEKHKIIDVPFSLFSYWHGPLPGKLIRNMGPNTTNDLKIILSLRRKMIGTHQWERWMPKGTERYDLQNRKIILGFVLSRKTPGGITVSGCKVHTSYGPCTRVITVMPCRAMAEEDKDFAVAFWTYSDTPGITMIVKPSPNSEHIDLPMQCPMSSAFGFVEGTTYFEDVFIPWEQVLLCGEWDMAELYPFYFGNIQRQSKCSCLAGHSDLVAGIGGLVADVNDVLSKRS